MLGQLLWAAAADDDGASDSSQAVQDLAVALGSTFAVVATGYLSSRLGFVSPDAVGGIGQFVGLVAMPPLMFKSVATLDPSTIDVSVLAAVLLSKLTVIALAALLGHRLAGDDRPMTRAGIYAYFVGVSNDLAIGLPIVSALYPESAYPQGFVTYVYLLATLQVAVVTPLCFVLMEIGEARAAGGADTRRVLGKVARGVLTNPLVVMVILGALYNAAFGPELPEVIESTTTILGNAFTCGALFLNGMAIVGTVGLLKGRALIVPTLLTALKCLLLPIILRYVMLAFKEGDDTYANFGFLYGSLPTGSAVVVIAAQYNIEPSVMSQASVFCLVASAPLMFVSSVLFTIHDTATLADAVRMASDFMLIASCAAGAIMAGTAVLRSSWRRYPMVVVLDNAMLQFGYSIFNLCCMYSTENSAFSQAVYGVSKMFRQGARLSSLYLAFNLYVMFTKGRYYGERYVKWARAVYVLVPLSWGVNYVANMRSDDNGSNQTAESLKCFYAYGDTLYAANIPFMCVCLLGSAFWLARLQQYKRGDAQFGPTPAPVQRSVRDESAESAAALGLNSTAEDEDALDEPDEPDEDPRAYQQLQGTRSVSGGDAQSPSHIAAAIRDSQRPEHVAGFKFRTEVVVVWGILTVLLEIFITMSLALNDSENGSIVQIQLISVFVVNGGCMVTWLTFGLQRRSLARLRAWVHRLTVRARALLRVPGVGELAPGLLGAAAAAMEDVAGDSAAAAGAGAGAAGTAGGGDLPPPPPELVELARDMRADAALVKMNVADLRHYTHSFSGWDLVSWLLANDRVQSREDAVLLGHTLQRFGLLHHVTFDHDFCEDPGYLYRLRVS